MRSWLGLRELSAFGFLHQCAFPPLKRIIALSKTINIEERLSRHSLSATPRRPLMAHCQMPDVTGRMQDAERGAEPCGKRHRLFTWPENRRLIIRDGEMLS